MCSSLNWIQQSDYFGEKTKFHSRVALLDFFFSALCLWMLGGAVINHNLTKVEVTHKVCTSCNFIMHSCFFNFLPLLQLVTFTVSKHLNHRFVKLHNSISVFRFHQPPTYSAQVCWSSSQLSSGTTWMGCSSITGLNNHAQSVLRTI